MSWLSLLIPYFRDLIQFHTSIFLIDQRLLRSFLYLRQFLEMTLGGTEPGKIAAEPREKSEGNFQLGR